MRITVIGGSGFIGTHLVTALLARGHQVRIFDLAPSAAHASLVTLGDVRDAAAVLAALRDCDLAIDLAAEHRDDVRPAARYFEVNVGGARNITAAATANGVARLLFVSSVAVYGRRQPGADEVSPVDPETAYGASKAEAERAYAQWQGEQPTQRALTVVRPTIVYGEGHGGNMKLLIEQLRRGRFVLVDGGRNRKSVAYVGNLVEFLCLVLESAPGRYCYNYADPPDPSTAELVREILSLLPNRPRFPRSLPLPLALAGACVVQAWTALRGVTSPVTVRRVRTLRAQTTVSVQALQRLGFRPRYSLREGLARTLAATPHD